MKKITVEFEDIEQANAFRDEMRKRFHYPKNQSKYDVSFGRDKNGNKVFVGSEKKSGVFSSTIINEV